MKFDVAIIGGGLAGLTCGIQLAEQGKRCAIISAGQSALHFSSGSLDFLSYRPDGSAIDNPLDALAELAKHSPEHPYSLLGAECVKQMAGQAERLLQDCGLHFNGSIDHNHLRVTPLGTLRATWLSPVEVPTAAINSPLSWKRIAVVGIEGFLDFQPQLAAGSLAEQGIEVTTDYLHVPALDRLRNNPSEFRATNISRVLDLPENTELLAEELVRLADDVDAVILPACIGLENAKSVSLLCARVGKPVMLVPTLPPSLLGIRMHQALRRRFQQLGGQFMPGDSVLRAEIDGQCVKKIYTRNHTDIPVVADQVVLASGSFFSNGLIAEFDRIYEPVFGLDVLDASQRGDWTQENMFSPQPYLRFGVKTDQTLRGTVGGKPLSNLYIIGAVLGGYDPLQQGCGAGVSLVTAQYVAQQILALAEVAA
ncbi:anaerobic glycerol-3-phosphate dehydrogenase subunit B [Pragia fontium]|uniref:Anaerobic glycerol-3-phosphate dehydrogenase subunit B n=1 Tax=Pragia fontium TaxID=82985 RepID=A0ABQ5LN11_9GAMM|nr:glycerol-3-phosphate dehydrogenase subunit GlpB [Pragia fontium]GKX64391.1 anaerobic glycerol-3-phosphate dehydrogenase subunit B [Pragia fontium]